MVSGKNKVVSNKKQGVPMKTCWFFADMAWGL